MSIPNINRVRERTKREPTGPAPRRGMSRLVWILGGVLLALIIIPSIFAELVTDWMWFGSQGLSDVYTTRLWLALGVLAAGTVIASIVLWLNWSLAVRIIRPSVIYTGQRDPVPWGLVRVGIIAAAIIVGFFMGLSASGEWPTILLYFNGGAFGQTDPLFNNDISFYVFGLPFFSFLRGWALALLVLSALGTAVIYLAGTLPQISRQSADILATNRNRPGSPGISVTLDPKAGAHLSVLGALFLLLIAVGYWLGQYDLLYSSRSVAYGAGYTDVNAKLPSLYIMMGVAVLMAVLLLVNLRVRTWRLLVGAVGIWLAALILVSGVYPAFVQQFVVKPSELDKERPYIQNNITATRQAFGLNNFHEREVPAVETVSQAEVAANRDTVENIRLWDYRPLLATYGNLQEIRSYYSFIGVDIDRYNLGGKLRQVMISARELNSNELGDQVRSWQNQRLVYTHGYGAVVSPVNEIVGEGLPDLLVKNIPPQTDVPELALTRPEIYYGEQTDDYVFVNSAAQEFDYPSGNENKYTEYAGKGGVAMDNFLTKLLFSVRFGDGNVLLSDYITPQTRVLFHRNIHDAVRQLAPFLMYDHDPYLVIADGRLYWLQDAYTYSDRYPYSTPHPRGFNYIRNSVKVVIDAYEGAATFYVADPSDPLVQAYRRIFPQLFKDISEMPASVRSHVRYPEDLMNYQAQMYATFHMTDTQVFYTKEDVWSIPFGTQAETSAPLEAYYVNMQLPGDSKQGFMLILPFTPATKDNMIAWMAAKSDGEDYGDVEVIRYPKQQLVYGPKQIEARIDQDPLISQQLTLWNASGSDVIRGNLLTIPIGNSVLYVEPLFLKATAGNFPELKRVIAATGNRVGIGADLNEALQVAFNLAPGTIIGADGGGPQPTPVAGQTPQPGATPGTRTPVQLTQSARDHYDRAQEALRNGDWTTYGDEIDAMKADLDQLAAVLGLPGSTPSPATTPGATPTTP
ncbi:MAG: uncharacterized protein QOH93_1741 [Chloroflexia bacterium]|nr:uncharacterized protein [Chloroflexia bacterium]